MILIGLVFLMLASLRLEHGPPVFIEYRQIRKPLNIAGVVLENHSAGKLLLNFFNHLCLKLALPFCHCLIPHLIVMIARRPTNPARTGKIYLVSIMSILAIQAIINLSVVMRIPP